MGWIKSDNQLFNHPKLFQLMASLGIERVKAVGHLHLLWWWCVDHALDGVLREMNDQQIAYAAEWTGDAKKFVSALIGAGFLERSNGELTVHDWEEWASDQVRLKKRRKEDERPTNVGSPQEGVVVALSFPVSGKTREWLLSEEKVKELQPLYPGVDVLLECQKALQWVKDNPLRRKTGPGMPRFLSGWLERSQNRPRVQYKTSADKDAEFDAEMKRVQANREKSEAIVKAYVSK